LTKIQINGSGIDMEHHRRSIRLPRFDYATPGAYFVTICTDEKRHLFGNIEDGRVNLNELGKMVETRLKISAEICNEIELDERIIMPNHIHFIIWIVGACATRPGSDYPSNFGQGAWHAPLRQSKSIASFVGLFKSKTTSISRKMSFNNDAKI
jgi:hypothetical protein